MHSYCLHTIYLMPINICQNNITNNPSDTDQTAPVKPATDRTPPGNTEQVAAGTELSLPGLN